MIYHLLNGSCLADQLKQTQIIGEQIICRECLMEGPVKGDSLAEFWATRAQHIADTYNDLVENYSHKVTAEFEKLINLPANSAINLWFEDDLFCQVNMWFALSLLANTATPYKVFRVFPITQNEEDRWKGFGVSTGEMLVQALDSRVAFTKEDIALGSNLWKAYKDNDYKTLKELSNTASDCFQLLPEVCQAQIDRFSADNQSGRPERVIKKIIAESSKDFTTVFRMFTNQEGIYGFGDLQVKNIYDKQMQTLRQ